MVDRYVNAILYSFIEQKVYLYAHLYMPGRHGAILEDSLVWAFPFVFLTLNYITFISNT